MLTMPLAMGRPSSSQDSLWGMIYLQGDSLLGMQLLSCNSCLLQLSSAECLSAWHRKRLCFGQTGVLELADLELIVFPTPDDLIIIILVIPQVSAEHALRDAGSRLLEFPDQQKMNSRYPGDSEVQGIVKSTKCSVQITAWQNRILYLLCSAKFAKSLVGGYRLEVKMILEGEIYLQSRLSHPNVAPNRKCTCCQPSLLGQRVSSRRQAQFRVYIPILQVY